MAERVERTWKLSFHRWASASLPLGNETEAAFQMPQSSRRMWPRHLTRSFRSLPAAAVSLHHRDRLGPQRALVRTASGRQADRGAGERRAGPPGRLGHVLLSVRLHPGALWHPRAHGDAGALGARAQGSGDGPAEKASLKRVEGKCHVRPALLPGLGMR